MAENNAPSLDDILIAIPMLSDPDLERLREAAMAECGKRNLPIRQFVPSIREQKGAPMTIDETKGSMLPIQEALNRVTAILDSPDVHLKTQQIEEHLDTIIEYARDNDELEEAVELKVLALNHIDSVGREDPSVVEENRIAALEAVKQLQCAIISRSADLS
jgi:hypothetical protein